MSSENLNPDHVSSRRPPLGRAYHSFGGEIGTHISNLERMGFGHALYYDKMLFFKSRVKIADFFQT